MLGINPISMVSTMAFGPMGGIVAQLATQVFSSMGQQLLQNFGQQLHLPQSQIDMAQASFAARSGDVHGVRQNLHQSIQALGKELGASHTDVADAQRRADEDLRTLLNDIAKDHKTRAASHGQGKGGAKGSGGADGSGGSDSASSTSATGGGTDAPGWLQAMADVLGKKLDELAHKMQDLAGKVNKDDPSTSTNFTVASQQFNMLMEASSTALKTIGEAMGKMAGRQ